MSTEQPAHRFRVVAAFTACRGDLTSLELAAQLAVQRGVELLTVFIEEVNLLNIAELPFVREIDRLVGTEQQLDSARIDLIHRASLSRLRRELGRIQQQQRIRANLTTRRGHFLKTAIECCEDVDLLIMARRRDSRIASERNQPVWVDASARQMPQARSSPIWCLFDGSPGSERAFAAARDIAGSEKRPLIVAVPEGELATLQRLGAHADGQRDQASSIDYRLELITPFDGPSLLRRIRRIGCRLIVVGRSATVFIDTASELADWSVVLA